MTKEMSLAPLSGNGNVMLFEKRTVTELSEMEMMEVDGGGTPAIGFSVAATVFLIGTYFGYYYSIP
jgi:lactobin A/cerein 7B family class IIb bacteriocin